MTNDQLVAAVERHPDGICTATLAREIGVLPKTVASRLSKLFYYGKISRTIGHPYHRRGYAAVWKPKVRQC